MKKYILFSLIAIFPLMSVAAPSVRMLGSKVGNPASVSKTTPVKFTVSEPSGSSNTSARVGTTMRTQKNRTLGGVSGAVTSGGTRFPVINIPKVSESADLPKVGGSTTNNITNNTTVVSAEEDPRVDMIKIGDPRRFWEDQGKSQQLQDRLNEDRVLMWIEVDD